MSKPTRSEPMNANRAGVKCPYCHFEGHDGDPPTLMRVSSRAVTLRCPACHTWFSVAIRRQKPNRRTSKFWREP